MQAPVSAALISNSPLVLAGLKAGLEQRGDFEIVYARDGPVGSDEAFARARVGIIDVATDADLKPVAAMADQGPALVLLWPDRDGPITDWLIAGHSLVPRGAPIETIAVAAHAAAAGLVATTPALAAEALRAGAHRDAAGLPAEADPSAKAGGESEVLTPREREVLLQMSLGLGNREIAQALHISAHTAKFHVAQIIAKLEASSRAHAVAKAMRSGLVEL
ncbi:MAG TPA: response regulator transcription factor [Burkholderiaceae bacterium]|nr:response regulator transcription factor [Burkholderiaceae bacterium]